jgi:hypothetical protein
MRLQLLVVTALTLAAPAMAQQTPASSADAGQVATQGSQQGTTTELPVSLDRIREGLKKPDETLLRNSNVRPDFSIQVAEQARIDQIISKLDFSGGPAPAGGLYGYEQQRRLFNPTERPLQQPYAAFNGGELITIAIENLLAKYLGGRALDALSAAERSRAEAQARQEVDQAIADYCAGRTDRNEIALCISSPER